MKNTEYIDLDRRFLRINDSEITDEDTSNSYMLFDTYFDKDYSWDKLLDLDELIVILGEAGSGKTIELEHQAQIQRSKGIYSFFIRLESFKNSPNSLNPDDIELFNSWLESKRSGVFFLDSVDESKLTQVTDFQNSILNLKTLIKVENLSRCKFIISSRISEWRPNKDSNIVTSLLSRQDKVKMERITAEKETLETAKPEKSYPKQTKVTKAKPEKTICVVKILPLNKERVIKYSKSLPLENVNEFIEQIDRRFAWDLVRRPLDIHDLAEYWKKHSTLGTLKDIIEYDIQEKLKEKNSDRSSGDDISYEKLREGSEGLAVSTILTNKLNFVIRDSNGNNEVYGNFIDPQQALPDSWSYAEIRSLLQRPLFDDAIYGKIRIHHRRKSEYLAASWFIRLFNGNCDYFQNVDLFFGYKKGKIFARVKYQPILAWLAIGNYRWSDDIRAKILKTCPEIFLEFGDPASLSEQYKIEIIKALSIKFGDKDRFYKYYEAESLSRLGNNSLGVLFTRLLSDENISENFKALILRIATLSATTTCKDEVFRISVNEESPYSLQSLSIDYISKFGSQEQISTVKEYYVQKEDLTNSIIDRLVSSLFPENLSVQETLTFLRKTQPVGNYDLVINYSLKVLLEKWVPKLDSFVIEELLIGLTKLLLSPPYKSDYRPISKRFEWLKEAHCYLMNQFFERTRPINSIDTLSKSLFIHVVLKELAGSDKGTVNPNLIAFANENISFRKSYGIFALHQLETQNKHYNIVLHNLLFEPKLKEDFQWILEELNVSEDEALKKDMFEFALSIWGRLNYPFRFKRRLKKVVQDNPEWKAKLKKSIWTRFKSIYSGFYYRHRLYNFKFWIKRLPRKIKQKKDDLLVFPRVIIRLGSLNKEENFRFVQYFYSASSSDEGTKYGKFDQDKIQKRHGRIISKIARTTLKKFWRSYEPDVPEIDSRSKTYGTIIGLMSIELNLRDGDLSLTNLSESDVQTLTKYALNEINGFSDWLETLTILYPKIVSSILEDEISIELNSKLNNLEFSIIHHVKYTDKYLLPVIGTLLLDSFAKSTTSNRKVLGETISVLAEIQNSKPIIKEKAIESIKIAYFFSFIYLVMILKLLKDEQNFSIDWLLNYEFVSDIHLFWIAVLLKVDIKNGLPELETALSLSNNSKSLAVRLTGSLSSRTHYSNYPDIENPSYLDAEYLPEFYKIIYEYVHPNDDINRGSGSYSPGTRDHAQDFRGYLFNKIVDNEDPKMDEFLEGLLELPLFAPSRELIEYNIEKRAERFVDNLYWEPTHIPYIMQNCIKEPSSDFELFRFTVNRLKEIRNEVLGDDTSSRYYVRADDKESRLRSFLKRELESKSNGFYTVPQELEIDQEDIPDLRVEKPSLKPVSIEVKKAEKWSYNQLVEGLRDQLAGKYLRSAKHVYGIYAIGYIDQEKRKNWKQNDGTLVSFNELIISLKEIAKEIELTEPLIFGIEVIGIDFTHKNS